MAMKRSAVKSGAGRAPETAAVREVAETTAAVARLAGAPLVLATVVAREGDSWRVRAGGAEALASVDASVDGALLEAARASGARVVLELGEAPLIVGTLQTARALTVGRDGDVDVAARAFTVTATEKVVMRVPGAFVMVSSGEVEVFANRVLTRAREVARTLAAMIKFN